MEDGVTEVQSLLPPLNLNPEDGSKREDDEKKEDGFVSKRKVEEVKQEDLGVERTGKDGAAKDEHGKGGLINNLISNLVSPLSPRRGKATEHESAKGVFNSEESAGADDGVENGERGAEHSREGGVISNIVSNLFHRSGGEGVLVENVKDKEDEEVIVDEKIKRVKTEGGVNNGGGGRGIHDIVSRLPPSLPDDAVPTADEASILINSLVRD